MLKFNLNINLILATFWDMGHFTIHEDNILWKYHQNRTRGLRKNQLFPILCVIKLYKSYFLGYFRYSAVLLLYRTYTTQFIRYRKGGLMTVDGCWKFAIFNQNSNLYTLRNWQKLKKKFMTCMRLELGT